MLDLKLDEWCRIPLFEKITRRTRKEMIKLLTDCGFVRAMYGYGNADDHWTVPSLLDYRAPIEIGTKYIYIAREFEIFPGVSKNKNLPNYGKVTIAQPAHNWRHDQWDIRWHSNEKREFRVVDEDFLCGYAKRLNRIKKELDLTLLSMNAEVENENG